MKQKAALLLADSQLLFEQYGGQSFLKNYLAQISGGRAAYIGAANDDRPEFFQIFTAAMRGFSSVECRHIKKEFNETERDFLSQADIILLAGGDVLYGWKILEQTGMAAIIVERYYAGTYLIGVSAGAIHLGLAFPDQDDQLQPMLKCIPFVIDVHQQAENWSRLKQTLSLLKNPYVHGIGIPFGGGVLYHPNHSIEALNKPAWLFEQENERLKSQLLLPKNFKFENEAEKA
ncbi:Type 1 glutamine amidotransferase-like domain-containing protein [Caldithrix abyssi]